MVGRIVGGFGDKLVWCVSEVDTLASATAKLHLWNSRKFGIVAERGRCQAVVAAFHTVPASFGTYQVIFLDWPTRYNTKLSHDGIFAVLCTLQQ